MPISFSPQPNRVARARGAGVTAVLGPTNTGKTHLAIERMLAHSSGMIGLPLRLLAREVYNKVVDHVGADARREEIDGLISGRLAEGWSLERLDRPMRAILRAGAYELVARADVPVGSVISEYVDVAHAFYDKRESGFVNGLLDAIAKEARPARAE